MKSRCNKPNRKDYKYYGGKGVTYDPAWEKFKPFEQWALANGYVEGLSIDRRDSNGNYEPGNCRFIPLPEQQRNKCSNIFFTKDGITKTLAEWARDLNIHHHTLKSRLNLGYSKEEALAKQPGVLRLSKIYTVDGKQYTVTQLAKAHNLTKTTVWRRLKQGLSPEEAIKPTAVH